MWLDALTSSTAKRIQAGATLVDCGGHPSLESPTRMIILLMGVTGAGKTTIGRLLAGQMQWDFVDADQFHSPANVKKMEQGLALTDADRQPWLEAIRQAMLTWVEECKDVVLACSALKRAYRERLQVRPVVKLVYLRGSYDLILARLQERHGHFATSALLASQFADLEEPTDALIVDAAGSPEEIVATIRRDLTHWQGFDAAEPLA